MSYTKTHVRRVQPVYSEDKKEGEKKSDEGEEKKEEEKKSDNNMVTETYAMSEEEIRDLVSRSRDFTWDDFFGVFDGQQVA